jgi:hypothetical protein
VDAPTTDSDTAASTSPTRSRTTPYTTASRAAKKRTAIASGTKHSSTTRVSCQE